MKAPRKMFFYDKADYDSFITSMDDFKNEVMKDATGIDVEELWNRIKGAILSHAKVHTSQNDKHIKTLFVVDKQQHQERNQEKKQTLKTCNEIEIGRK